MQLRTLCLAMAMSVVQAAAVPNPVAVAVPAPVADALPQLPTASSGPCSPGMLYFSV